MLSSPANRVVVVTGSVLKYLSAETVKHVPYVFFSFDIQLISSIPLHGLQYIYYGQGVCFGKEGNIWI